MDTRPEHLVKSARDRLDAGDPHGAIHILAEVAEKGEAFADAHNTLGLAYAMVGRNEDALAQFDRALQLNQRYVDAHLNRAVVLNELCRYDEAAQAFLAAQSFGGVDHTGFSAPVASKLANLHAELADAYLEAGGAGHAIAQLEAAASLRPTFVDLRYRLARLMLDDGQFEQARGQLETVVSQRPSFLDGRVALGLACYLAKDVRAARQAWEESRDAAPDDPRVKAYLALLDRLGA